MVVNYYLPHSSGLTYYVQRLAEGLVQQDVDVTVLCAHHEQATPLVAHVAGVRVVRSRVLARLGKGTLMPLFLWDVWRLLRSHHILHVLTPLMEAYGAVRIGKWLRKPVLITHHCDIRLPPSTVNDVVEMLMYMQLRWAGKLADKLVTYTRDYAAHSRFLTQYWEKVDTVYPPIVIGAADPDAAAAWRKELGLAEKSVIGFIGRFAADKGADVLLRALPHVLEEIPDAHLLFAGEYQRVVGERFYEACLPLIAQHKERITFLGNVPVAQMPLVYAMCDVAVVPSVNSTESFGMWQVESLLCGTPVVTTDLPGVRETVRVTGMGEVVPPYDDVALAKAIIRVLTQRHRYLKPKQDLKALFEPTRTVERYLEWYRELLAARPT